MSSLNNKLLLIYLIILLVYVFYSSYLLRKENIDNIHVHMGNHLSWYFHKLGRTILQKKDFSEKLDNVNFIKYLPSEIIYNDSEICKRTYDKFAEMGVTYENSGYCPTAEWFIRDNNHLNFWLSMKPLVQELLDNAFKKTGINSPVDCPVIHFRCSDVPFQRHPDYHLIKYEFYKKALEDINSKTSLNYSKVKILYSNGHLGDEKNGAACDIYSNTLKKYLEDLNYEVQMVANADIEDFANLFYAPAVISTVSSYSFMSGFFGKGIYITVENLSEDEEKSKCDSEYMYNGFHLKHKMVDDYYDTDNVIKLLSS